MNHYFVDADISPRIARMLAALSEGDAIVQHITEHPYFEHNNNKFGNSTDDVEWIKKLGNAPERWIVITGEASIIDTPHERAALIESGLTLFSLDHNWDKAGFDEQSWKIVKIWPQIVRYAATPGPVLYRVHMGKQQYIEEIKGGMRARGGKFRG